MKRMNPSAFFLSKDIMLSNLTVLTVNIRIHYGLMNSTVGICTTLPAFGIRINCIIKWEGEMIFNEKWFQY